MCLHICKGECEYGDIGRLLWESACSGVGVSAPSGVGLLAPSGVGVLAPSGVGVLHPLMIVLAPSDDSASTL